MFRFEKRHLKKPKHSLQSYLEAYFGRWTSIEDIAPDTDGDAIGPDENDSDLMSSESEMENLEEI